MIMMMMKVIHCPRTVLRHDLRNVVPLEYTKMASSVGDGHCQITVQIILFFSLFFLFFTVSLDGRTMGDDRGAS